MALADNIQHYWSFDSSNSNDEVGSKNGTDTSITYSSGNAKIDIGAGFNGTSSKIEVATGTLGLINAWTISAWIKPAAFTGNPRFFYAGANDGENAIIFGMTTGGAFFSNLFQGAGVLKKNYTSNTTYSTGTYLHFVGTWDGTSLLFYVNGSEVATTKSTDLALTQTDNSRPLRFSGTPPGGALLSGALDEIGMWSRALSSTEVSELHNGGDGVQYPFTVANTGAFFQVL